MHFHMEIVMPPTDDVEAAIAQIMEPFNECGEDEDGHCNSNAFWDWYVVGGRWSGHKDEAKFDKSQLEAFNAALHDRKVTVSGVQCGKQDLQPESQIPMVDALWREMFPESGLDVCPLFGHSPRTLPTDICTLANMPEGLTASTAIVAGPSYSDESKMRACYLIQDRMWNGVTHIDTKWDGKISSMIAAHLEKLKHCREEWKAKNTPQPDWLVVTVDYHS